VFVTPYNYAENSPIANIDLWGLQKLFFQKALDKNQAFQMSYNAQRQTSLGKEFTQRLENQNKFDVMYFQFDATQEGVFRTATSFEDFKKQHSRDAKAGRPDHISPVRLQLS